MRKNFYNFQKIEDLEYHKGEEWGCPQCHRRNAMISTGFFGNVQFFECRDCHFMMIHDTTDPLLTFRALTRSLGKQCSDCFSFDLKEINHSNMFICQNCGKKTQY